MRCLMVRCPGTCSSTVTGKLAGLWVVAHVTQVYIEEIWSRVRVQGRAPVSGASY